MFFVVTILLLSGVGSEYSILEKLNLNVNPCENFHDFVCGRGDLKPPKYTPSLYDLYQNEIWENVTFLLEHSLSEIRSFNKVKRFYKLCSESVKGGKIPTQIRRLLKMLNWPVLLETKRGDVKWSEFIPPLQKVGVDVQLFSLSVSPRYNDSSHRILKLEPRCPKYCKYLVAKDSVRISDYYRSIVRLAITFGAKKNKAEHDMWDCLWFELELCKICKNMDNFSGISNINILHKELPYFDWKRYIFSELPMSVTLTEADFIQTEYIKYFKNLGNLLQTTPGEVVGNYLLMQVILELVPLVGEKLNFKLPVFFSDESHRKTCLNLSYRFFPLVLNAMYVRQYVSKDTKTIVTKMANLIRDVFVNNINGNTWMDLRSKQRAVEKLTQMKNFIAYPSEYESDTLMQTIYSDFRLSRKSFIQVMMEASKWQRRVKLATFENPYNSLDWNERTNLLTLNAHHDWYSNSNEIPVSILQGLIFSPSNPMYSNFGGLGTIIAHEIAHSLDPVGITYDKNGFLVNWWENRTAYDENLKCMVDKYAGYMVDGVRTLNENFADMNGVMKSYLAYLEWECMYGEDVPVRGFTNRQMFWVSVANLWCGSAGQSVTEYAVHSPKIYRINGALSNSVEFAKDFNCDDRAKMNGRKKCKLF